jgi:predicted AAA+ superfamily ATPase
VGRAGAGATEFYEDYLATYLDRDLTQLVHVSNRRDCRRLLQACAVRAGQLLNLADLGRDVGIAADTVRRWLAALEAGGLVTLLPLFTPLIAPVSQEVP